MDARATPVGAVDPARALAASDIDAALRSLQSSNRDSEFPGRISTKVYADRHVVAKLRDDLEVPQKDPARWVEGRLTREREIGVYPPDRTWFLVTGAAGTVSAGVATLRRRPLHLWGDDELRAAWPQFCRGFADAYVRAAEHAWRLDEGLSNLTWDADDASGALFYLDDDLYPWDGGIALRMGLGVLARRHPWLGEAEGVLWAEAFRTALARVPRVMNVQDFASDVRRNARGEFLPAVARALVAPARKPSAPPAIEPANNLVALISDIHGNLDALDTVLADPDFQRAGTVLVLGDIVGYGPDSEQCVSRIRALPNARVLRGNHEQAVFDDEAAARFTRDARWAIEWTREHVSADTREWIDTLPLELSGDDWVAVHGALVDPKRVNAYIYSQTADDNLDALELLGVPVCFHGHTHMAGAWTRRKRRLSAVLHEGRGTLDLSAIAFSLVCPGGLGQARDGMPGAAYAVWDSDAKTVAYHRVAYDTEPVKARMEREGFPERLRTRLDEGK